jgi:hypothetical protein
MVNIVRSVDDDSDAARRWIERLVQGIQQDDHGAYVNFFGPNDTDRIHAAYPGQTLARLQRIKATYDPSNLFRHNDNILADPGHRQDSRGQLGSG